MSDQLTQTVLAPPQYAVGVVSVQTRGRSKGYSYHAAKLYVRTRGRNGWYWKATRVCGPSRRGSLIVQKDAEEIAQRYGCSVLPIRHGSNAD